MSKTYIPILKTKDSVEKTILLNERDFFISNHMVPYLEITKEYPVGGDGNKTVKKMCETLTDLLHFEEMYYKSFNLKDLIRNYREIPDNPNIIMSIRINSEIWDSAGEEIKKILISRHEKNLISAIRIPSGLNNEILLKLNSLISKDDWLIIDIGENDYDAVFPFLNRIQKLQHENTAVFSIERANKIPGSQYTNEAYDEILNTSLTGKIIDGEYPFKAFGTYASLKDSLTEGSKAVECYGVLLLYNKDVNMFYSIRTAEKDHISRIYKKIKEQVKADLKDRTSELSKIIRNPLAVKYWEKILRKEKNPRAVDFLCVSAMQYLTEIVRLISS